MRLATIADLARSEGISIPAAQIAALLASSDPATRIHGVLLKAARLYGQGHARLALDTLCMCRTSVGFMPTAALHCAIGLCSELGMEQCAADECLSFARDSFANGYLDIGMEAAMAALILDGMGSFRITRNPLALREIAGWYETVALGLSRALPLGPASVRSGRSRIGIVVPNLVDDVVAATKTVLHLVRHIDRRTCDVFVYSSENLSMRDAPQFPYGCSAGISEERGRRTIAAIADAGSSVHIAGRTGTFSESATDLASRLTDDRLDAIILQSGLSCPIDWLAVRLAPAPAKMCIHTGASLFMPGMDMNYYDNPANIERESADWNPAFGMRTVLKQGTDIDDLRKQTPLDRSAFGIPAHAVVIGTMSNHLDRRLSPAYLKVVAEVMQENDNAWFIAFGSDDVPSATGFFRQSGVLSRVRWGGRQSLSGAALKILDIYANEFPVGGSQSVIEAMACGIPVAALRWSDAHAECAGATAVGDDIAIQRPDTDAYRDLLKSWVKDTGARQSAGIRMSRRAEAEYSVKSYAGVLAARAMDLVERKRCA